ncbi:MAG: hypothetical protein R2731_10295 [Nocardioides sp.]
MSSLLVAVGCALWCPSTPHAWRALLNMAIAGLGSGAVAALGVRGGSRAPRAHRLRDRHDQPGTKTVGGAIASQSSPSLASTGSLADVEAGHAARRLPHPSLVGVAVAALAAAAALAVPRDSFADAAELHH